MTKQPAQVGTAKRMAHRAANDSKRPTQASAFLELMSACRLFVDRQSDMTFAELERTVQQARQLKVY